MEFARDLGSADLWAESIERSLARRGRARRASLALARLTAERDLADPENVKDSLTYWRARRAASANPGFNVPAAGGASVLALLAATTIPALAGGGSSSLRRGGLHRSARGGSTGATPARSVVHRPSSGAGSRPSFSLGLPSHPGAAAAHATRSAGGYSLLSATTRTLTHVLAAGPTTAHTLSAATTNVHVLAVASTDIHVLSSGGTAAGSTSADSATTVASAAPAAGTTAAAATAPATARKVVYGKIARGDIWDAQRMLGIGVDGILGPKTGAAIRAFQSAHGLDVDGVVGPATWNALARAEHAAQRAAHRAVFTNATAVVREASTFQPAAAATGGGSDVMAVQQKLGVSPDGTFGATTLAAVKSFQDAHGLGADGVVGPATRAALGLPAGPVLTAPGLATGGTADAATTATDATATDTTATAATTDATTTATADTAAGTVATTDATGATTADTGPASSVQTALAEMIAAGNAIATLPYIWGGGHGSWVSPGYDCSGSVSYVLHAAGLLSVPEDSGSLESYGAPGPGQYVTIYANAGHAWMTIEGRRFDTVALDEDGSRWGDGGGEFSGFVVRHPVGF